MVQPRQWAQKTIAILKAKQVAKGNCSTPANFFHNFDALAKPGHSKLNHTWIVTCDQKTLKMPLSDHR
jgi:hypothetical protein